MARTTNLELIDRLEHLRRKLIFLTVGTQPFIAEQLTELEESGISYVIQDVADEITEIQDLLPADIDKYLLK